MRKSQVLFSNELILEDSRRMKLDYSLTEKYSETNLETPYYGILVTKQMDDLVESDEIAGVSYSKDTVISILKKLFQFEVTPISVVEIVDELVTQGI